MEDLNMEKSEVKNNDSKKIFGLIVIIATLMITTTSATYAWLAFSASNATTVTGTVADSGLTLTVTESALKKRGITPGLLSNIAWKYASYSSMVHGSLIPNSFSHVLFTLNR